MDDTLATFVIAAQHGDLDAFGQVAERFEKMAYAVAYTIVGDAQLAEDAAQEAFIEAFMGLTKLREPAAFPGWFRRIVMKRADRLIRGKRQALASLDSVGQLLSGGPDPAALAEARELQRRVHAAISTLPTSDQQMIMLFYMADHSQQEIAELVDLPATTVKKRLFRARRLLRQQMDDLVGEYIQAQRPAHNQQFAQIIQFFIAVRLGDTAQVRAYLDRNPALLDARERWDATTALQYGLPLISSFTALHRAAYNGDHNLTAVLLSRRAKTEARTQSGETPLHLAVQLNYPAVVQALLAGSASPHSATNTGLTPLHCAVILSRPALARLLLAAGAHVASADQNQRTPLDWALLKGDPELIALLTKPPPND